MEERIYNLLSNAWLKGRLLTTDELKEIFNIYIKLNGLEEYVTDIIFDDGNLNEKVQIKEENKTVGAFYDCVNKILEFGYNTTIEYFKDESNILLNYELVILLLHELNHVIHFKLIDNIKDKDDFNDLDSLEMYKAILILVSYYYSYADLDDNLFKTLFLRKTQGKTIFDKVNNHYHKNHDLFPCERFASLDAIEYLRKLLFKYETNDDNLIIQHETLIKYKNVYLFKGYNKKFGKIISPSFEYLDKFGLKRFKKAFINYKAGIGEYNKPNEINNLLYLGLPVEKEKYNKMHDYYDKASDEPIGLSEDGIKKLTRK